MKPITLVTVTGAGGFVGTEVVRRLAGQSQVRALVRRRALSPTARGAGVDEVRIDDLSRPEAQDAACADADTIVHLAARVHRTGESASGAEERYLLENAYLTASLARSAARSGVRRFVFLSSVKALGERSTDRPLAPGDEPRPEDSYGRSKLEAERLLAQIAAETSLEVVILRPPLVYGPDVGANFRQLVRWVRRGVPLPFGSVANRRSMVSVWNLADAVVVSCTHPAAAGGVLHVADAQSVSTPDLIRNIAAGLGRRPRMLRFPPALLAASLRTIGKASLVDRLLGSLELDTSATTARLGWMPTLPIEEGLRRAAREMAP